MTELMRTIIARKTARRKQLAALPVGEKLRMLVEMREAAEKIAATRPSKREAFARELKTNPALKR